MIRNLVMIGLMAALPQQVQSAARPPACLSNAPTAGRLFVQSGPVRLIRGVQTYVLRESGQLDLCALDRLTLIRGSARIIVDRVAIPMVADRQYSLKPYAERSALVRFIAESLAAKWNPLSAVSKVATSTGQGDDDVMAFRVAGLDSGIAQIGEGERMLHVTFSGPPGARGTLIGPDSRKAVGREVQTSRFQAPRFAFPKILFRDGERWTVRIAISGSAISGSFRVIKGPLVLPEITTDPGGQDGRVLRSLARAGSNPEVWSFEALQFALEPGANHFKSDAAETMLAAWNVDPSTRPGSDQQ